MNSRWKHRWRWRNFGTYRGSLLVFARNPQQGLEARLLANTLEIVEELLSRGRDDDGVNGHVLPSPDVDIALPCPCIFVVLDRRETLWPILSLCFIRNDQPYPVAFRDVFQGPGDCVRLYANTAFRRREEPILSWLLNLDLLPEPSPIPT